jgi:hypothetical protein
MRRAGHDDRPGRGHDPAVSRQRSVAAGIGRDEFSSGAGCLRYGGGSAGARPKVCVKSIPRCGRLYPIEHNSAGREEASIFGSRTSVAAGGGAPEGRQRTPRGGPVPVCGRSCRMPSQTEHQPVGSLPPGPPGIEATERVRSPSSFDRACLSSSGCAGYEPWGS